MIQRGTAGLMGVGSARFSGVRATAFFSISMGLMAFQASKAQPCRFIDTRMTASMDLIVVPDSWDWLWLDILC